MSKVDAQRAMREARYATIQASGPPRAAAANRPATPAADTGVADEPARSTPRPRAGKAARAKAAPAPESPTETETEARCGHRNMGNKSCQRPAGHSEKAHRYK